MTTPAAATEAPLFEAIPGKLPNGVFTCIGPKGHRTIKIATVSDRDRPLYGRRIIYVMTGADNLFAYTGVGFLNSENGKDTFIPWNRQKGTELHKIVLAFLHIVGSEAANGDKPHTYGKPDVGWESYRVEESRHCLVCNRLLTNPESLERGVGPVCAGGEGDE